MSLICFQIWTFGYGTFLSILTSVISWNCRFREFGHRSHHLVRHPGLPSTSKGAHRDGSMSAAIFRINYGMRVELCMRVELWPQCFKVTRTQYFTKIHSTSPSNTSLKDVTASFMRYDASLTPSGAILLKPWSEYFRNCGEICDFSPQFSRYCFSASF